jgi:homocysteine S-methyltransferase
MSLAELITRRERVLTEGSVYELLRRDPRVRFDPLIAHAGLIYEESSRSILADVHRRYFAIARDRDLPLLAFTDTWRASAARVAASPFRGRSVNRDHVSFLRGLASDAGGTAFVAGMSGPHGDGYLASEAPSRKQASVIHRQQIEELASAGVDVLFAATLPSLPEALGIADVMASTGSPWLVSFVVRPSAVLLDGTPLADAIRALDALSPNALGISLNCVHPTVASAALSQLDPALASRVVAFQGNTSALSPEELDGQAELQGDDAPQFAASLADLAGHIPIVGGCCGTDVSHMTALADRLMLRSGERRNLEKPVAANR